MVCVFRAEQKLGLGPPLGAEGARGDGSRLRNLPHLFPLFLTLGADVRSL